MRIVLFVEGDTEQRILPPLLGNWLRAKTGENVGVTAVKHDGWSSLLRDVPIKAPRYLSLPDVIAVVSMIDLYGPNNNRFYPVGVDDAEARVCWGRKHFETRVGDRRYRHYFAVHEIEAWLLSQPEVFANREIASAVGRYSNRPESIDFDEPPARLLERLYRQSTNKRYRKNVDGPHLFRKLDLDAARLRCPHLSEMLDEILELVNQVPE